MKKSIVYLILLGFGFIPSISSAQNLDQLVSKPVYYCNDIAYNCGQEWVRLMVQNKLDSAKLILNYWQGKCGAREPIFRATLLLNIANGTYSEQLVDSQSIDFIYNYTYRQKSIFKNNKKTFEYNPIYFGYIPIGEDFDAYTQILANELIERHPEDGMLRTWLNFYGGKTDSIFTKVQQENHSTTNLRYYFDKEVNRFKKMSDVNMAVLGGVWIPTGGMSFLGPQTEVGFQMGVENANRLCISMFVVAKFGRAEKEYLYFNKVENKMFPSKEFSGVYMGGELGYKLLNSKRQSLGPALGVGFDAITVKANTNGTNEKSNALTAGTYNFNVGLGYQFRFKNWYLGLQGKYNLVDYTLNKTISFTGNPISVRLVIGTRQNEFKKHNLKNLMYQGNY